MKYDVIIIGAGPGGLFNALTIRNKKVMVLEKNDIPGKKILISGAGQCNYTNNCDLDNFLKSYGDKGRFLKPSLYNFTNKDSIEFFKKFGLESITRDDNKVFPKSFNSKDILNVLIEGCKEKGVELKYNCKVDRLGYDEYNKLFIVKTQEESFACENLVIATGGMSYPNTGSTGDGYGFAESLGHTIIAPKEALTPVYIKNYCFGDLSGISFENIKISLYKSNKKVKDFTGDMLFTHSNLSGPVIINNSRYMDSKDILKINFTSYKNEEEFRNYFENKISLSGKLKVKTILKELNLPKRFIDKILGLSKIDDDIICSQLPKQSRKKIIELLSNNKMTIEKLGGFHIAMVTKGGVATDEINSKTMESKIIKNLYFVGEVMDIDGNTGGFNLQAAFSTGKLAAENIIAKNS
ncbi:NAD(P)/FAD-dependent oxidoreductase [Sedimentibacter sp. MB31-C6]|uniref:NAD(P)/FAD-dependent oxidoreductase n=1 Tax=Sedimentibacter sp. MB31-C6 TaxID=3109366 RepID=UPI002DDD2EAB|nr:NAD(P)/FAD-dependent oxidoreductase [Sedimentibacter sp. MB36-C1]WSI05339.1 NAD(P)/FAD-dependent oxidoreductase [Sedimentibacter sp. MB36-C1]